MAAPRWLWALLLLWLSLAAAAEQNNSHPRAGELSLSLPPAAGAQPTWATGPGAGWERCGKQPQPNPGAAAGCAARGRAPARWLAEVPAAPTPAFPQGPHALLRQGCHQSSRDAAAVLCPSLLCTSSSPERRVPVSPQLVSPPSRGCPWWRWRRGCLLPPSPPLGAGWERAAHGGAGCCRHAPVLVGVRLPWTSAHQDP